jgi:cytochrome c553
MATQWARLPVCPVTAQMLEGNPALKVPALAGLPAVTVLARLAHYAGPSGHNPTMRSVATALDQSERTAVANYIASLPKAAATQ